MNLRELTNDQLGILELVNNGDLSEDDVKDHLDMITDERNKKIENILYVISDFQSTETALKRSEERRVGKEC